MVGRSKDESLVDTAVAESWHEDRRAFKAPGAEIGEITISFPENQWFAGVTSFFSLVLRFI
jgi:hypothetical protein